MKNPVLSLSQILRVMMYCGIIDCSHESYLLLIKTVTSNFPTSFHLYINSTNIDDI